MDTKQLEAEGRAVQAEIETAFGAVTRDGGVSWSESKVLDDYGSKKEQAAARASETDRHWSKLVDDPGSLEIAGSGGFSFLDPIGFRYYLAVAMMQIARGLFFDNHNIVFYFTLGEEGEFRAYSLEKWSLLDTPQRQCVRRFLRYMAEWDESKHDGWGKGWQEALDSYWEEHA